MNEDMKARDLFAQDYLLIADNDSTVQPLLARLAKSGSVSQVSDTMREHYEDLADKVCDLMIGGKFSEFESLLIRQLLCGWGSDAFDTIARELVARD